MDTADTGSGFVDSHTDVTGLTPVRAPGVPDNPVFLTGGSVSAPADHVDGVIQVERAIGVVEDTARVALKILVTSSHKDA